MYRIFRICMAFPVRDVFYIFPLKVFSGVLLIKMILLWILSILIIQAKTRWALKKADFLNEGLQEVKIAL